jgi:hypothetical protein
MLLTAQCTRSQLHTHLCFRAGEQCSRGGQIIRSAASFQQEQPYDWGSYLQDTAALHFGGPVWRSYALMTGTCGALHQEAQWPHL